MRYEYGVCSRCDKKRLIVNKTHNLCEDCNHIRLHGKTKIKSSFQKSKGVGNKRKNQIEKDEETYEEVFREKPYKCENCGAPLPTKFRDEEGKVIARFQYSHILSKGAWPQYRNKSWNIMKNCLSCHGEWDFGEKQQMPVYKKCKQLIISKTGRDLLV